MTIKELKLLLKVKNLNKILEQHKDSDKITNVECINNKIAILIQLSNDYNCNDDYNPMDDIYEILENSAILYEDYYE